MCGLFGLVQREGNVTNNILLGLKDIEYRGYDSSGIAFFTQDNDIECVKRSGKLIALEEALEGAKPTLCAISHTRWATHGAPTDVNAHPHQAHGRTFIAHNGIIENHQGLIENAPLLSETDSEKLAFLIDQFYQKSNDPKEAIRQSMTNVKGQSAILTMFADHANTMYATTNRHPLIIGMYESGFAVCSDIIPIKKQCQRFALLPVDHIAVITATSCNVYTADGELVELAFTSCDTVDIGSSQHDDTFPHIILKEIMEQPQCAQQLINHWIDDKPYEPMLEALKNARTIGLIGSGSSMHAAMTGRHWIEQMGQVLTLCDSASEYVASQSKIACTPEQTAIIALSQSGETADVLRVFSKENPNAIGRFAMTNRPFSSLENAADHTLSINAGIEHSVASTKAITNQMVVLFSLAIAIGQARHNLDPSPYLQALRLLPQHIEQVLEKSDDIKAIAESHLVPYTSALYLGRYMSYPMAREAALKLKEIAYIHAEGIGLGDLKHGPLALISPDTMPVVAMVDSNHLFDKGLANVEEIIARNGRVVVMADQPIGLKCPVLDIPKTHPMLTPILFGIVGQLLAYHAANALDLPIDRPRNLAKSVTVE